jgi:hypothetical protein
MNKLEIDSFSINTAISSFLERCANDDELKTVSKSELYTTLEKDQNAFVNYGRYPLLLLNKQIVSYCLHSSSIKTKTTLLVNFAERFHYKMKDASRRAQKL